MTTKVNHSLADMTPRGCTDENAAGVKSAQKIAGNRGSPRSRKSPVKKRKQRALDGEGRRRGSSDDQEGSIYRCKEEAHEVVRAFNEGVGCGPPNLASLKGAQLMIK